ncbi:MAG: hypothetical protein IPJ77_05190 [Planctomycetes bacterium]|nr:hypothetical protein [Planctomycetota bacterium]
MPLRFELLAPTLLAVATAVLAPEAHSQVNLTAGDVAVIGWTDNGTPSDVLTIVNLAPLPAGTTIFLTDNGWTGTAFRNTVADGDGNEQLLRFTVVNTIAAGRVISTTDVSADFTWDVGMTLPGATGVFSVPALAQAGDQITLFQHDTGLDPMNTATQAMIFVIDDTGTFEPATSSNEGDVATGLSVVSNTAVTFAQNGTGQNVMSFNTAALTCGTKADWLAAIANVGNWTFGSSGTLPSGTIPVGPCTAFNAYCFGDGIDVSHTTACPCANTGGAGNGCANSVNPNGANLTATGAASSDDVVLAGSGMPATVSCIYLQGDALADTVFGDGVRCAGGTLIRLRTRANVAGASSFPDSTDTITLSQRGGVTVGSGAVRYYQTYYRNSAALFCPPETFNVSNGWLIAW